jgi:hypothetical protein
MKKRLLIALTAGALVAAMVPGVASADYAKPEGQGPTDAWLLGQPQPGHVGLAFDHNDDTWVCLRVVPGGAVFMDNAVRLR